MAHLPQKSVKSFELCFAQQDLNNTAWTNVYKMPVRGVSLMFQDFGNSQVLGQGISLFGHTSFPIVQGEKFGFLDFRLGTGVAFVTKRYDNELNPKNNAIGSYINGFVNLQFNWDKHFEHFHLGAGIEFSHYSNAAMKVPNLGLNIPSLNLNIGYSIARRKVWNPTKEKEMESNHTEIMSDDFHLILIGGSKQNVAKQLAPKSRPVIGLSAMYSKSLGRRWKLDGAIDLVYNDANRHYHDTSTYTIGETFQLGAYFGASVHFYKAAFVLGLGAYMYSPVKPFGLFYNRLGFRYHFTPKIVGTVAIKAHWGIADYLEIGLGYKLWSKK